MGVAQNKSSQNNWGPYGVLLSTALAFTMFLVTLWILAGGMQSPIHYSSNPSDLWEGKIFSYSQAVFNVHPTFLLWVTAFGLLSALSFGIVPGLVLKVKEVAKEVKSPVKMGYNVGSSAIVVLVVIMAIVLGNGLNHLVSGFDWNELYGILINRNHLETVVGYNFIAPAIAFYGLFKIAAKAGALKSVDPSLPEEERKQALKTLKNQFTLLRSSLKFFLSILGALISASVITTALFRKTLIDVVPVGLVPEFTDLDRSMNIFPIEFLYAYALLFTGILFICYAPVYSFLKSRGVDLLNGLKTPEEKKDMEETFAMKATSWENIKTALAVVGPSVAGLVTAIFSEALKP